MSEAAQALNAIVDAELRAWVPGASQRLIKRAADRMGLRVPVSGVDAECEADRHCLVCDWAAGIFVLRCTNCDRLVRG